MIDERKDAQARHCAFCNRELASDGAGAEFTARGTRNQPTDLLACSNCVAVILPRAWEMRRSLDYISRRVANFQEATERFETVSRGRRKRRENPT